mmetsp:Transcript_56088/g.121317  ORF Transcript_56088/g.121317 Transcript_56088/m.121317 type:complete len:207 (-) Transcript_56088:84-704(-)
MKFLLQPKGEVDLGHDGAQIMARRAELGVRAKDISKVLFSTESVKMSSGKGFWFELRVDEFAGGHMSLMALGFTSTDPASHPEEEPLPPRAYLFPKTWIVGYARSAYWDGDRSEAEDIFKSVVPFKIFQIGALATLTGSLEIYINRRLAYKFDPTVKGLPPMPIDEPLWAVVDCVGGIRKAMALISSPPQANEEVDDALEEDALSH